VLAAALTPLITVLTELLYLSTTGDAPSFALLPFRLAAALGVFVVAVIAFRTSLRVESAPATSAS
jgi:hypothetical protein